ncbi:MAG: hypothetical protein QNJ05_09170 [Woeseiaceae bacterium]|nr:hypothetical protein [Woeseiaceae bacterium]
MPEPSEPPPPSGIALAAAAGGFGGAVLGVIAATMIMGNGDNDAQVGNAPVEKPATELVAARAHDEE